MRPVRARFPLVLSALRCASLSVATPCTRLRSGCYRCWTRTNATVVALFPRQNNAPRSATSMLDLYVYRSAAWNQSTHSFLSVFLTPVGDDRPSPSRSFLSLYALFFPIVEVDCSLWSSRSAADYLFSRDNTIGVCTTLHSRELSAAGAFETVVSIPMLSQPSFKCKYDPPPSRCLFQPSFPHRCL